MIIRDSINEVPFEELANIHEDWYFRAENIRLHHYRGYGNELSVHVTDLADALKPGREVTEYIFTGPLWDVLFFTYDEPVSEVLQKLFRREVRNIDYRTRTHQAIRVFSPFVEVKSIKPPAKWTLAHVWKAILAGQIKRGQTDQRLTDDYAFDAANNYGRGEIDVIAFARRLIEDRSGWWVMVDRETDEYIQLGVNCHHFDSKTLFFEKVANPALPIMTEDEPEPGAPQEPETQSPKRSNVINFAERVAEKKVKSFDESLTPEQRLKLMCVQQMMGREKCAEALMRLDFDVDELFRVAAQVVEGGRSK
jgi:hypothetical protein